MVRVMLVDDQSLFRNGVSSLLTAHGHEVVAEASNGREALAKVPQVNPDIILMDIRMLEMGGLEATRLIKAQYPEVKIVILTVSDDEQDLFEAIKSGAYSYLLKNLRHPSSSTPWRRFRGARPSCRPALPSDLSRSSRPRPSTPPV